MNAPTFPMPVARMRAWFTEAAADFGARLAPAYVALDWQWKDAEDGSYYPAAGSITDRLVALFEDCLKLEPRENRRSLASGGLMVAIEWDESPEEWACTMDFGTAESESFGWESES